MSGPTQSARSQSARSVTFSDTVDYATVTPYSVIYGWAPHTKVATNYGWKIVSQHACHWTGKLADMIKMRLKQRAAHHDHKAIDMFRRTMLRTCNAHLYGDVSLLIPTTVAAFLATEVTGQRPQLKAHPSLCLSVMKRKTHAPASSGISSCPKSTCARTGAQGNQCRPSTDHQSHNRVTHSRCAAHGGAVRRQCRSERTQTSAGPQPNGPSMRNCYGSDLPTGVPTPTYADVPDGRR